MNSFVIVGGLRRRDSRSRSVFPEFYGIGGLCGQLSAVTALNDRPLGASFWCYTRMRSLAIVFVYVAVCSVSNTLERDL